MYHLSIAFAVMLLSCFYSADQLEEIVGLDISYHGGIAGTHYDEDDDEQSRQANLDAYYEQKRQQRAIPRGSLRRRSISESLRRGRTHSDIMISGNSSEQGGILTGDSSHHGQEDAENIR